MSLEALWFRFRGGESAYVEVCVGVGESLVWWVAEHI